MNNKQRATWNRASTQALVTLDQFHKMTGGRFSGCESALLLVAKTYNLQSLHSNK